MFKIRHSSLFVLLLLTFLLPSITFAQEQEDTSTLTAPALDSLVVTATRIPMEQRQTGRRVIVWTAADIAAQPALTVTGLLQTIGGVSLNSRAGFGVQSDFTIRGSSFKGVLILLDGIPINGPQTAHYLSDFPVPLSAIARIEVLRGSASSLYGPNAIGGVIQIFTYAGLHTTKSPFLKSEGAVRTQYGAHSLYDIGGAFRHSIKETTFYAASAVQGTQGEPILNQGGNRVTSVDGPLSTDFTRQTHTVAVTNQINDAMLYARLGIDHRDFNAYHFYTGFNSDKARSTNRTYWLQVRLQNQTSSDGRWQVQLAAKQHEGLYVYNPKFSSNTDYARKLVGQAQISRPVTSNFTLTGGASTKLRGIESASMGDHGNFAGGFYIGGNLQATNRLTLNASNRLDYDDSYGWQLTPNFSAAYNLSTMTFRAAAGRAVRAPTYTERFIDTEVENPAGNLGNPDLDPEKAWSFEAGIDIYPANRFSLHATAFYRKIENLIDYAKLPGEQLYVARNILRAQTRGLELGVRYQQSIGNAILALNGSYTLLDKELGGVQESVEYKYALTNERQLLQGSARLAVDNFTFGLRGIWKDRRSRVSYGVVHAQVTYLLPIGRGRFSLSLKSYNIFDKEYAVIFDAPMPGRWWIAGLRYGL